MKPNFSTRFIKYFSAVTGEEGAPSSQQEVDQIERNLVNLITDGVFIGQDSCFVYANPALTAMLGYTPEEFMGLDFTAVVAPEFLDIWRQRYKARIGTGPEPPGRYEVQFLCKGGSERIWLDLHARRIQYNGRPAVLGVLRDISEYKTIQSELIQISRTDPLTGLANRSRLIDLLQLSMQSATRRREKLAILFMDLDGFKDVNDTLGHTAGDQLLREVANRLKISVRSVDIISRFGGDEFVIVLQGITDLEDTIQVADKILSQFDLPFWHENRKIRVGASIGISHYPDDGDNHDLLLKYADNALYRVKNSGKNSYCIHGYGD